MLPDIHNEHLAGRQREQRRLALEVLVLATLAAICALNVHDEDVVCHFDCSRLVLREPDALGRLLSLSLGHNGKVRVEEGIEESGLAGRLRAEGGYEMGVEGWL